MVGPDHEADSWAWPDTAAHPDVIAAIAAIRAGLRALPRERLAASPPSPDAVRRGPVARADLGGVAETLDGLSLLTLGERALAAYRTAVPRSCRRRRPPRRRVARAGLGLASFEVGVLAPLPPRAAPSGPRRGGSYASEGVRGPRPADKRPVP